MPRRAAIVVLLGLLACPASEPGVVQLRPASVRGAPTAESPLSFEVTLEVAGGPAEVQARILVGLPHWYYGMRGSSRGTATITAHTADGRPLPAHRRSFGWGRWYAETVLDRAIPVGDRIVVEIRDAPPVGVPGELSPLVLFDRAGGDEPELISDVPSFFVAPASRPPVVRSRAARPLESGRRVVFADLHGHSALSDGRGTPASYFRFAKLRGGLQVAALSDHDWQLEPLELVALLDAADAANEPGEFVALPALEINLHGHEVAWFFDSDALRTVAGAGAARGAVTLWEETDFGIAGARFSPRPRELLMRLRASTLTASHTTLARGMGSPVPGKVRPAGEACIEIYSAHGSSECADCDRAVLFEGAEGPTSDVRAHLAAAPDLCLIAAGDSHDGRPGDTRWGPHSGGLTGLEVDELTRAGVLAALRAGRTWATTGRRTVLEVNDAGTHLRIHDSEPVVNVTVVDAATGTSTVVVRGDRRGVWIELPPSGRQSGRYVRVRSLDGGLAWTNPRRR